VKHPPAAPDEQERACDESSESDRGAHAKRLRQVVKPDLVPAGRKPESDERVVDGRQRELLARGLGARDSALMVIHARSGTTRTTP